MLPSLPAYRIHRIAISAPGERVWQASPLVAESGKSLGRGCFADLLSELESIHGRGTRMGLVFSDTPFSTTSFADGRSDEHWWLGSRDRSTPLPVSALDLFSQSDLTPLAWSGSVSSFASIIATEDLPIEETVRAWLVLRLSQRKAEPAVILVDWPFGECDQDAFGQVQNALLRDLLAAGDPARLLDRLRAREQAWETAEAEHLENARRELEPHRSALLKLPPTSWPANTTAPTGEVRCEAVEGGALRTLLAKVDHVTLDLFDTVFHRRVSRPRDVFWLLGLMLERETGLAPNEFADRRIAAENELRAEWQKTGKAEDVSLYPIYERLAGNLGLTAVKARQWADRELELERRLLAVNPEFARWQAVLEPKVRLCLSEMYLPGDALMQCLADKSILPGVPVWTSGDIGLSKGSGRLYERAERHLQSSPDRLLHVGDNPSSDIGAPARRGWNTFHWAAAQACRLDQPRRWTPEDPVCGVALGVIRADRRPEAPLPWQVGFELMGPIVWAWINHLARQPSIRDAAQVWLLARDGYWLERIWKALPEAYRPGGELRYVWASRQLWGMAAIEDISATDWDFLLKAAPDLQVRDFFERVGIDVSRLPESEDLPWNAAATGRSGFVDTSMRDRLYRCFVEHITAFHEMRAGRRERVLDYLKSLNPDGQSIAMVDLGWHGSSCETLSRLARNLGWNAPRGHYFATWREAMPAALAGARFEGFFTSMGDLPRRVMLLRESVALLENLFAAPHPTITDLTPTGEPRYGSDDPRTPEQRESLEALWQGVEAFCSAMGSLIPRPVTADGSLLAERALERLLRFPQPAEAALFADWAHVEGWGVAQSRPLITRPPTHAPTGQLQATGRESAWPAGWSALLSSDQHERLRQES